MEIKMAVLVTNSDGQAEFFRTTIKCSESAIENGDHFEFAIQEALDAGYEGTMLAFSQNDPAAKSLGELDKFFQD